MLSQGTSRRRRLRVFATIAGVVVASVVVPAGAQEPPATGEGGSVPTGASGDELSSGGETLAMVEGQVLVVGSFAGGMELPVKIGTSAARLRGRTATATSGTMDLGLLGDLALLAVSTAPTLKRLGIDTSDAPAYMPMPRPVTADSRGTMEVDNRTALDAVRLGPVVAGGGHETASAPDGGPASSRTELGDVRIDLGVGQLLLAGGVAETEARATEVVGSISFGEISFSVNGNPLAVLRGVEWQASQVLGEEPSGAFVVGSATVAGTRYPSPGAEALGAAASAMNAALVPAGVTIELPEPTDTGVAPLRLMMKDSPAAFEYLNPLYSVALSDAVNGAEEAVVGGVPETGLAVTVANVFLAALTGRGGTALEVGGLTTSVATTPVDTFSYDPLPARSGSAPPSPTGGAAAPAATPAPAGPSGPSGAPPSPDASPTPAPGPSVPPAISGLPAADRTVASVVPEKVPAAAVLGLGGLAVVAAWLLDRRRVSHWAARR